MGLAGQLNGHWSEEPWRFSAWCASGDPKLVFSFEDLKIRDATPAAAALLRMALDELKGQPLSRVLDASCMLRLREAVAEGRLDGLSGYTVLASEPEEPHAFAASVIPGGEGLCQCRLSPLPASEVDRDLRRLNWALAAYARSSSALIRSATFKETVAGVCEAIVGEDDYLAAAVGLAEKGPGRPIRLVAGGGLAAKYIDGLPLSWSEEVPEGCGPAGVAIRTNRAFLIQDTLKEPAFAHWRKRAGRFGIRSSVTVPFGRGPTPSGVLIVYAGQPDAFGERELDVFSRLSRELAFALEVEDDRALLRRAEEARRAAEDSAQESLAELARAARAISVASFASSIAHEVNQPVAAIVANTEAALRWLAKDPPNLDEARAALERITRDAGRTSAVVGRTRGMLTKDFGRRQKVDLGALLQESLQFTEAARKRAAVKVEIDAAADLPSVWADPVQIQQVMVNLIANAHDAMKGVSGRKRVLKILTASLAPGEVTVSVSDTGSGVEEGNLEQIFTHLFTTKPDGMGLGLPISKAIVEAHGGRLDMARNEPHGAVFRFTLPVMGVPR
jgi:signal transduction histidine kinase